MKSVLGDRCRMLTTAHEAAMSSRNFARVSVHDTFRPWALDLRAGSHREQTKRSRLDRLVAYHYAQQVLQT